jgi:serine/threonine protein kinase
MSIERECPGQTCSSVQFFFFFPCNKKKLQLKERNMSASATTAAASELPTFGKKHGLRWARLEKKYKIGDMLGEGNFAKVYRGVCKKTNEEFALKVVQKKSVDLKRLAQEVAILSKLKHAHIMGFRECIETKTKVVMVCEVLEGGELFDRVVAKGSYSEAEAALVSKQLLQAIEHAHQQDIVHRDLKVCSRTEKKKKREPKKRKKKKN